MNKQFFAYGIVDKNNEPYINVNTISKNANKLKIIGKFVNDHPNANMMVDRVPVRVVKLFWGDQPEESHF